jgi:AraC-like DNA-binding protein
MAADPLSDALALVGARCQVTGGLRAGGQWSVRFRPEPPVKIDAVVEGHCWLVADGQPPVPLAAGEAVVLSRASAFVLCSDPALAPAEARDVLRPSAGLLKQAGSGDEVVVIGGHVEVDRGGEDLLLPVLPPVTHVAASAPESAELRQLLQRLLAENTAGRPGSTFAAGQYAQLLLVQVLRLLLERPAALQPGWLSLLGDPALRPALTLMHEKPGYPWTLEELASAAAMSRTTFATRFRAVAGQPPGAYLTRWRIRLAERALRDEDSTVAALAAQLGYASESSFSHAFQRVAGTAPGRYRRAARAGSPPAGGAVSPPGG